jgi:NAD(P)H-dependent FMN reductase
MSDPPRILAFAGSAREGSFNKRLVRVAAGSVEAAGVSCTLLDLRDFPLPIYDGDLEVESGLPDNAAKLKDLFLSHHGLLISSPEYNSSISPLLKNVIDWVSRSSEGGSDLSPFRGKLAGIMAASPGSLGGLRGLAVLRSLLGNIGCTVISEQVTIGHAHEAFTTEGNLADPKQQSRAEAIGRRLARLLLRWHAA